MNNSKTISEIDHIIKDLTSMLRPEEEEQDIKIKNAVIVAHNAIEGFLNLFLINYYFGGKIPIDDAKSNHFYINILGELDFVKKLKMLEKTESVNQKEIKAFHRINDIRNDLAHYPHRVFKRKGKHLMYLGKHIFKDIEALELFRKDCFMILDRAREIFKSQKLN